LFGAWIDCRLSWQKSQSVGKSRIFLPPVKVQLLDPIKNHKTPNLQPIAT